MGSGMRGIPSVLLWVVLGIVLAGPGAANAGGDGDVKALAAGNNAFALALYDRLRTEGGNLFFSPYSISTALAMTYGGAGGDTRMEMARTLRFELQPDRLHSAFERLRRELAAIREKGAVRLDVANALWPRKGDTLLPEYLRLIQAHYGAEPIPLDFENDREGARLCINQWIEDRTHRMIRELIKPGVLGDATRLVLTNAIYFKGDWESQFSRSLTREAPFWLAPGKSVNVPMMSQKADVGYAERKDWQILELPYVGNDLSMIVLLPRQVDGLGELESGILPPSPEGWLDGIERREVVVFLPKFKLSGETDLRGTLSGMGMPRAFGAGADFSGMDGTRMLHISAALHKAFVDIGEEGTEAAAATAVVMRLTAVSTPSPVFRADHPFVFLIRENRTNSILFMGRFARPEP